MHKVYKDSSDQTQTRLTTKLCDDYYDIPKQIDVFSSVTYFLYISTGSVCFVEK